MEEGVLSELDKLAITSVLKNVYVVEYKGTRLVMKSGKSSWATLGAAKNALRHSLSYFKYNWRSSNEDLLSIIHNLEKSGVIKYLKL